MGARPIALLDGLRFGAPDHAFERAVAGSALRQLVGVPTVGGEAVSTRRTRTTASSTRCASALPSSRVTRAKARGAGQLVVLYGATTGRDGIGGASVLASQELGEDDADKRPTVQIGDPFTGKKLIETSLELVEAGLVESLQDCGAAGLASALAEMASDGAGIDVHLDRVPQREAGMEAWEVMISESQERMVAVVRPQMLDAVRGVCARWELPCTVIGEVTDDGFLRAFHDGDVVGEIAARFLTDECPRYVVEAAAATEVADRRAARGVRVEAVGLRAVRPPRGLADRAQARARRGGAAARPSMRGLAVSLQGGDFSRGTRFRRVRRPSSVRRGTSRAPAAARSVDGLPQLRQSRETGDRVGARRGDRRHRRRSERDRRPVVSGNVSLYNETDGRAIPPTPVVGCVGLVPDVRRIPGRWRGATRSCSRAFPRGARRRGGGGARRASSGRSRRSSRSCTTSAARGSRPRSTRRRSGAAAARSRPAGGAARRRRDPRLRSRGRRRARLARPAAIGEVTLAVCGVFGIRSPQRDVARVAYFGLFALQHRGQESAGIAVSDEGRLTVLRDMGLVSRVFDEQNLSGLHGEAAIGHTRYSTTGSTEWANAQPLLHHGRARTIALGHNGDLTNAAALRAQLAEDGVTLSSTSDSELIAALIASVSRPHRGRCLGGDGAARGRVLGHRAVRGHAPGVPRPARLPAARARPARRRMGRRVGDVRARPGRRGLRARGRAGRARRRRRGRPRSVQAVEPAEHGALCIFEFFYLAARTRGSRASRSTRRAFGWAATRGRGSGRRRPRAADPRVGYARRGRVLARQRHPVQRRADQEPVRPRTFIQPDQELRRQGARLKYHPVAEVAGKRVVAVDDSIVRGNTTREIVRMLFDSGAAEVHVASRRRR